MPSASARSSRARSGAPSPSRPIRSPQTTTTRSALWSTSAVPMPPPNVLRGRSRKLRATAPRRHFDELRVRRGYRQRPAPPPARRGRRRRRPGRSGPPPRRRRRGRSGGRWRPPAWRRCGGSPCGFAGRGSGSCGAGRCRRRGSRRRCRCRGPGPRSRGRRGGAGSLGPARGRCGTRRGGSRAPRAGCAGPGSPPRWRRRRRSPRSRRRPPAGRRRPSRSRPPSSAALAAPQPRAHDPLLGAEHLEAVAALVAEPAVVDLGVVARQHPLHLLVADGEADVALARAERADRAGLLDVPGPGAEAVGVGGQRPDRAELGDVAVEGGDVGAVVEGADVAAVAALQQLQLRVLGDLLAEAHAAVAEDAALAVDRDQRRERQRLLEVALGVGEAAVPGSPAHRDVLQRALAALVADRAVERVVDEQELDHRALRLLDLLGAGVDDHPVADRGRAGGLQLRHPLDLDQAHPAGADRRRRASARSRRPGSRRRRAWRRRGASRPRSRPPRARR